MSTKTKKMFALDADRPKLDVRMSRELDNHIEEVALKLGTSKNSILVVGAAMFCKTITSTKHKAYVAAAKEMLAELEG